MCFMYLLITFFYLGYIESTIFFFNVVTLKGKQISMKSTNFLTLSILLCIRICGPLLQKVPDILSLPDHIHFILSDKMKLSQ